MTAVLVALCAADVLVVLDGLVVAVALPSIQQDLGIDPVSLQWVVNAYVLAFGGLLLLGGRLGDLYGRRRVLLVGLVVFAAGSLLGGLAWSPGALLAGRAVQGVGAALMAPTALSLLVATFPEGPPRVRALGWWSAAGSAGIPAGALLGGVLTAGPGWRWVLLVNAPAALLAAVATRWVVPESREGARARRLDVPGAVVATAGLTLVVLGVVRAERLPHAPGAAWAVVVPLAVATALLVAFVRLERRVDDPLVPPDVVRSPGLVPAGLVGAALPVGLGAVLFLATLHLQEVLGWSPMRTGLAYLALALPVVAASPLASWLVVRGGRRTVAVLGFVLQGAGLLLLARAPADATFLVDVLPGFALVGAGAPLAFVPVTAAAVEVLGDRAGLASGLFTTAQQVGNAVALAALATLATAWTGARTAAGAGRDVALTEGYGAGFLLAAAMTALAAVATLRLPRGGRGENVPVSRTVTS